MKAKEVIKDILAKLVRKKTPEDRSIQHQPAEIHYPATDWIDGNSIRTILDIGANTGDFAIAMARRFPQACVVSFEPLADAFATLKDRTSRIPRCKAMRIALGDAETEVEIQRCAYSPSSSILPMAGLHREAFPFTAGRATPEVVRVRRLDGVAREIGLPEDMLVKIDVQGFEGHVIRGGQETLRRARVIIVETSFAVLYDGQPLFAEIHAMLGDLGFCYSGNWDQLTDPRTGRILQADAIFVRRP